MSDHQRILILDFGSQYTQLIARRIREQGVYAEIRPCTDPAEPIPGLAGLVLSGGPDSVHSPTRPAFDRAWLDLDVPVLGICYGMQLLADLGGGHVGRGEARQYGLAELSVDHQDSPLFRGLPERTRVWMSHGDHVDALPSGWVTTGSSGHCAIAAMAHEERRHYGIQFHPEVHHSEHGTPLLRNFLFGLCGCAGDWTIGSFLQDQIARIRELVGPTDKVVCGLSGGVDSSVVAALLHEAIPDQLHCVFVDNGLLRKGERESVASEFSELNLHVIDASSRFLEALAGVADPERKRKIIGEVFIRVFEEQARLIGDVKWLAQGTLYPDVIESVSFRGPSATIKSHHNVGGLPEHMDLDLIEPLRELFKDEVRRLGAELGLSEARIHRQPFPGPGLAVRNLGPITAPKLALLREADAIVTHEIGAAALDEHPWQYFAVLLPVQSVGVMGDERTYEYTAVVRAVTSTDGMTADWARLPHALLGRISRRIINEVRGINRVCYDISSKPPATIEWE